MWFAFMRRRWAPSLWRGRRPIAVENKSVSRRYPESKTERKPGKRDIRATGSGDTTERRWRSPAGVCRIPAAAVGVFRGSRESPQEKDRRSQSGPVPREQGTAPSGIAPAATHCLSSSQRIATQRNASQYCENRLRPKSVGALGAVETCTSTLSSPLRAMHSTDVQSCRGRGGCSPSTKANRVQSLDRVTLGFSQAGIVPDDAVGQRVFSAISRFLCPSIFISITLIGSQDLAVKSRPNLFTHSFCEQDAIPDATVDVCVSNIGLRGTIVRGGGGGAILFVRVPRVQRSRPSNKCWEVARDGQPEELPAQQGLFPRKTGLSRNGTSDNGTRQTKAFLHHVLRVLSRASWIMRRWTPYRGRMVTLVLSDGICFSQREACRRRKPLKAAVSWLKVTCSCVAAVVIIVTYNQSVGDSMTLSDRRAKRATKDDGSDQQEENLQLRASWQRTVRESSLERPCATQGSRAWPLLLCLHRVAAQTLRGSALACCQRDARISLALSSPPNGRLALFSTPSLPPSSSLHSLHSAGVTDRPPLLGLPGTSQGSADGQWKGQTSDKTKCRSVLAFVMWSRGRFTTRDQLQTHARSSLPDRLLAAARDY
ncbi:hypothetical protein PR048_023923 [Dryococelus australis]|uniref:Uncharacterized protein n=1 Tax=Dryococelus australis TaxID=614101 RepID=A0ABQ9GVF1_9NEOP|nr:hypothetical protein PR048_023923 [Dryococelus australis]